MKLVMQDLTFAYPGSQPILRGVNLTVVAGDLLALVGANGAGKSTLLSLATGYRTPSGGEVLFDDLPVASLPPQAIAKRVACLEQDRHTTLDFTVREVVAMGRIPHRGRFARETSHDRQSVDEAMELTETAGLAGRSVHSLSGGERQRVYLATALAQDPEALLLDEPTTHFDIRYQMELMEIIAERACSGLAVVVAVHDLNTAAAYAHRIALLQDGRIAADGSPADVLTETAIADAFHARVSVRRDPDTGHVTVIPRPTATGR